MLHYTSFIKDCFIPYKVISFYYHNEEIITVTMYVFWTLGNCNF